VAPEHDRLAMAFEQLAGAVLHEARLTADLERLVRIAVRLLPQCSGASISMIIDGQPTTVAVTDRVTLELVLVEYETDNGPCVVALAGDDIRIGYVPQEAQFPHFARGADDSRVLSVLSTPAIDSGVTVGSLNLYSRAPDAFDRQAEKFASVIAASLANALARSAMLASARLSRETLQEDYDERALVDRAVAVLMAFQDCSDHQARELIKRAADANQERPIEVAERIIATAEPSSASRDYGEPS
jgi:GAF domain-containing protein